MRLRIAAQVLVATVVILVWLVGYALAYFKGAPKPTELNYLMAIVVAWVLGDSTVAAFKRYRITRTPDPPKEPDDPAA